MPTLTGDRRPDFLRRQVLTSRNVDGGRFVDVLLGGLNDRPEEAAALGSLLAGRKAHANLIPYNPVEGLPYRRPSDAAIRRFAEIVREAGVSVSVRKTKGRPIDAACGQLRRRHEDGHRSGGQGSRP